MAIFCIPKSEVQKLKDSALKGEIDIKKLYGMSSADRRGFFEKHTDKELGKFLNTEFEKAMISKGKTAFTDFARSIFSAKEKSKPVYKNVLDKINALNEAGILSPKSREVFLEDLVSEKLGVTVSPDEVTRISKYAEKIQAAQEKVGSDLGNPSKMQENVDFFKAKKQMDDYLQSLNPASNLKVATGTIGRGMMLASVKSPILNIGSNIEIGFAEALSRRIASGSILTTDNGRALDYVKMVNKIYQETGYDLSRMVNLSDSGASGQRVLGETVHTQGSGPVRKVGRIVEDIVFKQLMGAPDVAFSAAHFADSVNLQSLKIAKGNKKLASTYMEDAMRIEPQTVEGEILRAQAIMDAQKATWTDTSWASKVSGGIRKILNDVSGDARVGDYVLPFIKTPANVIATGMDYAGMGFLKAAYKTFKSARNGTFTDKGNFQNIARDLTRAGLGLVGAYIVSQQLKDEDFVGAFDPSRAQIEQLRNSNYNAIRLGGKWVSTDWLGPLSVPVSAMMYARKYGKTPGEKTFQYAAGVLDQIKNLPGVSDAYDYARSQAFKKNTTLDEAVGETRDYFMGQAFSRLVPSFLGDVAKATDTVERQSKGTLGSIMNRVPGLRQTLPEKKSILGDTVNTEPAWSSILFGQRVKTSKETPLTTELNRLSVVEDKSINFTDWSKSSSQTLAQFKKVKGQEVYDKATVEYGRVLKARLDKVINSPAYKRLDDENKLRVINNLDTEAQNTVFKNYSFKYKQATKDKLPKI